jgi:hypothetical protein
MAKTMSFYSECQQTWTTTADHRDHGARTTDLLGQGGPSDCQSIWRGSHYRGTDPDPFIAHSGRDTI